MKKTVSDMKSFQRNLLSINKGNEEVLDLPVGDLDFEAVSTFLYALTFGL